MKKISLIGLISLLLISMFTLFSCTEEKYYVEDPNANWDILSFTVDAYGGGNKGKWVWNNEYKRFECTFNISSDNINLDDYIYDNGISVGYIYLGEQWKGETQYQLPWNSDNEEARFWYDTSISRDNSDLFTVRFYMKWYDESNAIPPSYNFRIALLWGNR